MDPSSKKGRIIYSVYDEDGRFDWPPRERVLNQEQLARRVVERNRGLGQAARLGLSWFLKR